MAMKFRAHDTFFIRKGWLITSAYQRDPQESKERMMQHLSCILPGASVQQLTKILKG